jgi:hypothetical protein
MTIRCAWCRELLGYRPPMHVRETSHGICAGCFAEQCREMEAIHARNPVEATDVNVAAVSLARR